MVVGRHLQFLRRVEDLAHGERAARSGRRSDAHHPSLERCDSQLLAAEPGRQAGPDSRTRNRHHDRPAKRSEFIAASAPNFAARSTRTWRSSSTSTAMPTSSNGGIVSCNPRPLRRLRWRKPAIIMLRSISAACATILRARRRRPRRSRPHPSRQPADAGRRHDADEQGQSLRLGRGPAIGEARHQNADDRASSPTTCTRSSLTWRHSNDRMRRSGIADYDRERDEKRLAEERKKIARDGPKLKGAKLEARLERTWARPPGIHRLARDRRP